MTEATLHASKRRKIAIEGPNDRSQDPAKSTDTDTSNNAQQSCGYGRRKSALSQTKNTFSPSTLKPSPRKTKEIAIASDTTPSKRRTRGPEVSANGASTKSKRLRARPSNGKSSTLSIGAKEKDGSSSSTSSESDRAPSDPPSPTRSQGYKKKPHWRGWVEVEDDGEMPVNNQNAFEDIARKAAEEAAREKQGGSGRKTLRERRSTGEEQHRTSQSRSQKHHSETKDDKGGNTKSEKMKAVSKKNKSENRKQIADKRRHLEVEDKDNDADGNLGQDLQDDVLEDSIQDVTPRKRRDKATVENGATLRSPSSLTKLPVRHATSSSNDTCVPLNENAKKLRSHLSSDLTSLQALQSHLLSRLTSSNWATDNPPEYQKIHQLLAQTVLAGEGNSMLLIGPRGTGKSALVEQAIRDLSKDHSTDFHVVRLNGFVHTDDKIALKEIWRQLGREMDVDDESLRSGRSNFADILARLLALLSHQDDADTMKQDREQAVAKSVIFILSEIHLFASHSRQSLLYNLFDLAQSSTTPLAVLGLTPRADVIGMLEKRVKSRFGQRIVQTSPPKTLDMFKSTCHSILSVSPTSVSDLKQRDMLSRIFSGWNEHITNLLEHPAMAQHLSSIYSTTRSPSAFATSCLLPVASLSASSPLLSPADFLSHPSLQPPDSNLVVLPPALSTLALSLLIAAARLEILLAPSSSAATINSPVAITFDIAYEEYVSLAAKSRVSSSSTGASFGAGQKVWGKAVAKGEWERLGELAIIVPAASEGGRRGEMTTWYVDVGGLEEIGAWVAGEGRGNVACAGGAGAVLGRWCKVL